MEEAVVGGRTERVVVPEPQPPSDHDCGRKLESGAQGSDAEDHSADVTELERTLLGLGNQAAPQAESPGDEQCDQRGERHDPEATDLDQAHQDRLAEMRVVRRGVDHDEPGHADRRRRGEDRGQERAVAGSRRRDGEPEE
jgi:hypothetical protein